ncbi:PIN domain-containing protein [Catellatospora sp. NPDC049111]|uniref:PIN domain-containing protein n=1 Tax=Catellatospora sp. NPDC049111 TaxID=3155271 RepID=UPI0033E93499
MISAVLDACVLVPSVLADTLLRCAEDEHYRPLWSAEILDEVRRNLPQSVSAAAADRRIQAMRAFFPEAEVDGYQDLVDQMTNHPKDRHVLAAAVAARADFVVTANLRDFPVHALDPHAIEAQHPDDFLCDLLDVSPSDTQIPARHQSLTMPRLCFSRWHRCRGTPAACFGPLASAAMMIGFF